MLYMRMFVLLALFLNQAFGREQIETSGYNPSDPVPGISVAVSLTPLSSPFFIAEELGFFTQQNVNVKLLPCQGGVACAEMLFNQRADLATFSDSVVMFQGFKSPVFSVLTTFVRTDSDLRLLTLKKNDIVSVAQLADKKVGVVKASASEFYIDSMRISHAIDKSRIHKVYLKPDQLGNALQSGLVDAISVWEPWGHQLEVKASQNVADLSLKGIYSLSFNLSALTESVEKHRKGYLRVLSALEMSINWMTDHPDMAKILIAKRLNVESMELAEMWESYAFRLSLSNSLLSELQLQARWAKDEGLVKGPAPKFRNLIDNSFLKQLAEMEHAGP